MRPEASSRPEVAFVLLLMQSLAWLIAGISAAPFALGGEVHMAFFALATMLLALVTLLLGIGVLWRRRGARAIVLGLEVACLGGTALQLLLPLGFNRGIVSMLVNVAMPLAILVLLRKDTRQAFS
jgi:hypothetical protein